jgi:opacity protein-like surface antigen
MRLAIGAFWMTLVASTAAHGQGLHPAAGFFYPHRFEIGVHGGYVWTGARDASYSPAMTGQVDLRDSAHWGITVDFTVAPNAEVELLYNRQESEFVFRQPLQPEQAVTSAAVEYWHLGGLYGVPYGKLVPFACMTAGATRIAYDVPGHGDTWKLSFILGGGVKAAVSSRLGLRAQARVPFTLVSGGIALGCGSGGCTTTIGGTGVLQFDVSGGAFVMF